MRVSIVFYRILFVLVGIRGIYQTVFGNNYMRRALSALLWIILPLLLVAVTVVEIVLQSEELGRWLTGEGSVIENLTVFFLLCAVFRGLNALVRRQSSQDRLLRTYFLVLLLGCVFFAGEELSWGQHLFGWQTPDGWAEVNRQKETNLHNTVAIFDKLPRSALTMFAVVGSVFALVSASAQRMNRPVRHPSLRPYIPPVACAAAGFCSVMVTLPTKVLRILSPTRSLDFTGGETKECLLALFLFIYISAIVAHLRSESLPSAEPQLANDNL